MACDYTNPGLMPSGSGEAESGDGLLRKAHELSIPVIVLGEYRMAFLFRANDDSMKSGWPNTGPFKPSLQFWSKQQDSVEEPRAAYPFVG